MNKLVIRFLSFLFFLSLNFQLYTQVQQKLYFDQDWKVCKAEDAKYFRITKLDTARLVFDGAFSDFTLDSNQITSGNYSKLNKEGEFKIFDGKGQIKAVGNFKNDKLDGPWTSYYSNGKVKQIVRFSEHDFQFVAYNDSLGNDLLQNQSSNWQMSFISDFTNQSYIIAGTLVKGKKEGRWEMRDQEEVLGYDVYKNGEYKKSRFIGASAKMKSRIISNQLFIPFYILAAEEYTFNENVSIKDYPLIKTLPEFSGIPAIGMLNDSLIFKLDKNPSYSGGPQNLYKVLAANIKYPIKAKINNITGKVIVEIIIDEHGKAISRKVIKKVHPLLDAEALRATSLLVDWKPAIYQGKAIQSKLKLPISFNL
ncbi:MAG: hypothetical protein DRI89_12000 [Bacteroidetes bacterium]|nr:MAG: hypothetical protein DRI89_12000 [Bacteroidota bacterium]